MSELTVSVVIPTYNRAQLLGRAIQSVLSQLGREDEVIVVDDGSTDGTAETVAALAEPRILNIRQSHAGAGAARNRGVAEATRDLIAFLDSDDEWLPGKLAVQRHFMETRDEVLFCFTDLGADQDGKRIPLLRTGRWHDDLRSWDKILSRPMRYSWFAGLPGGVPDFNVYVGELYHGAMYYNYFSTSCLMVRREQAAGAIHFAEDVATYEEWECLGHLARQGKAAFLDFVGSLQHKDSGERISDADWVQRAESRLVILQNVWGSDHEFLKTHGAEYRGVEHDQELARIRGMIVLGRRAEALEEMRKLRRVPIVYRSAALLPAAWMSALVSLRHSVNDFLTAPAH